MLYVIQVLSAILIGLCVGAILGLRTPVRLGGSVIAIALGAASIVTGAWLYLAIGTAIFLLAMLMSGGTRAAHG